MIKRQVLINKELVLLNNFVFYLTIDCSNGKT